MKTQDKVPANRKKTRKEMNTKDKMLLVRLTSKQHEILKEMSQDIGNENTITELIKILILLGAEFLSSDEFWNYIKKHHALEYYETLLGQDKLTLKDGENAIKAVKYASRQIKAAFEPKFRFF